MSNFLSGRQRELKVGISSFTENKTTLSVVGNANISGIITALSFSGNASSASYSVLAGIATYASTSGVSTYAVIAGVSTISTYASTSGLSTSATFASSAGYATVAGIATYAPVAGVSTYAIIAGVSTNVVGGIASITQLSVSGVSTLNTVTSSDIFSTGIVTASGGFNLGISSGGIPITSGPVTRLNFIGAGNTFAVNGTTIDVSIAGGGGASVSISTTPPTSPTEGDLWYSSNLGRTFIYYVDDDSSQWVDSSPFNIPEPDPTPAKTTETFTATASQTSFSYTYKPGFIDVFLNGIRLNSTEFIANNGTSILLLEAASLGDVLDVVEYTMGIGTAGPQGPAGPLSGVTSITSNGTYYPIIASGIGSVDPYITVTNNYFRFNPQSGTLFTNQLSIAGVSTFSSVNATQINSSQVNISGVSTFSSINASQANISGVCTALDFNSTSDKNLKHNIQAIQNPIEKVLQINGVSFEWKDTNEKSAGVIAQEVELVMPEIIKTNNETKTVNYNGLVGLLIESVKNQQEQINILKEEIRLLKEK